MPDVLRSYLTERSSTLDRVTVVDSTDVISSDVQTTITELAAADGRIIEGAGVTQTSADIAALDLASQQTSGISNALQDVFLATIHAYPDSLTGGPLVASTPGGVMLLINGTNPDQATHTPAQSFYGPHNSPAWQRLTRLGGDAAISPAVWQLHQDLASALND